MSMPNQVSPPSTAEQIAELRFVASKMDGAERRALVAEIALKYGTGHARQAEQVFGWGGYKQYKRVLSGFVQVSSGRQAAVNPPAR